MPTVIWYFIHTCTITVCNKISNAGLKDYLAKSKLRLVTWGKECFVCLYLFSLCLLIFTGFSFDFYPVYFISFVVFTYWLAFCIYYFKNTSTFMPVQYNHKNSQWSKIYPRYVLIVLDLLVQHTLMELPQIMPC